MGTEQLIFSLLATIISFIGMFLGFRSSMRTAKTEQKADLEKIIEAITVSKDKELANMNQKTQEDKDEAKERTSQNDRILRVEIEITAVKTKLSEVLQQLKDMNLEMHNINDLARNLLTMSKFEEHHASNYKA